MGIAVRRSVRPKETEKISIIIIIRWPVGPVEHYLDGERVRRCFYRYKSSNLCFWPFFWQFFLYLSYLLAVFFNFCCCSDERQQFYADLIVACNL